MCIRDSSLLCRAALIRPNKSPNTMLMTVASVAISKVAGIYCARSDNTGCLVRMDVPMSPWNRFFI